MEKKTVVVISLILVALLVFSLVLNKITGEKSEENFTAYGHTSNATSNTSTQQETPSAGGGTGGGGGGAGEQLSTSDDESDNETTAIPSTNDNETDSMSAPSTTKNYSCEGCELDNECYPVGYTKSGQYCSSNYEFVNQLESDSSCDNNFECSSNVCVAGNCISEGFINKILNWFKRIFGGD